MMFRTLVCAIQGLANIIRARTPGSNLYVDEFNPKAFAI